MIRFVVCASVVFALSSLVGCSGSDAPLDIDGSSNQKLQTKKDGSATGDGTTCTWENTTTYDVCAGPTAPIPTYRLGDEFKSIDGCNECACTAKGIMCTIRECGGGTTPPSPPIGTVCTADAMKCPDGSYVSRGGPSCEFAPCPGTPPIACDLAARICKDGSTAKGSTTSCQQWCPEDGPYPGDGLACPAVERVCKNNVPPKHVPNSCDQICPEDQPVACTDDARQCPDGSYVGRSGPNCEFVCPKK